MRKFFAAAAVFFLFLMLPLNAAAISEASRVQNAASVYNDGSCQISLQITFHLDEPVKELSFPIPKKAQDVTINGSRARVRRSGDVLNVDLSGLVGGFAGDFSINIRYTLSNIVKRGESGRLELTLPLLSGFAYPVESMDFTVTLPGEISSQPTFTSIYYQARIEEMLSFNVLGANISGALTTPLKDREALTMVLEVSEDMFPQSTVAEWSMNVDDIAMTVLAVLCVLYWLVFLRCLPPFPIRRATPPEGLTAGELGSTLTMQGADLTMMVVSWAQLGYILIQVDGGRVLLHKRMDMGNERSAFEVRCFKSLFGKRQMIDGSSLHYAKLCRKIAAAPPNTQAFYRRSSGNPKLFRILAAGIGLFGGMSLGAAISGESTLRGLTIFLLSILGAAGSWFIQSWAKDLHMRSKQNLWIALAITGVWLFLSLTAKEFNVAAAVVSGEFLAGLFSAYGGRRTGLGRQAMAQVLGLRRYLKTVSPEDLQRINRANPEYFYSLAPYALALGVDGTFAKHFGSTQLPGCPYLTTGMDGHMTAMEWSRLMRSAVSSLDARQKRLPLERFLAK